MILPNNLNRGVSAIALGLALTALTPGAAMAQDASTAPVDEAPAEGEIVVSGIRGAINNGLTKEEIKEVFLQVAIYCGVPAAVDAFRNAREAINEYEKNNAK